MRRKLMLLGVALTILLLMGEETSTADPLAATLKGTTQDGQVPRVASAADQDRWFCRTAAAGADFVVDDLGDGPTPAVTVVPPVVTTVMSEESIVTAGTGMAEAVTMAEEALADETAHPGSMRAGFQGTPIPASPIATVVPPSTSMAEPREIVVTPETGLAGAQSEELSSDVNNGGPPFTAIGIAAGAGVAGIVLAVGVFIRVVRGRPRAD